MSNRGVKMSCCCLQKNLLVFMCVAGGSVSVVLPKPSHDVWLDAAWWQLSFSFYSYSYALNCHSVLNSWNSTWRSGFGCYEGVKECTPTLKNGWVRKCRREEMAAHSEKLFSHNNTLKRTAIIISSKFWLHVSPEGDVTWNETWSFCSPSVLKAEQSDVIRLPSFIWSTKGNMWRSVTVSQLCVAAMTLLNLPDPAVQLPACQVPPATKTFPDSLGQTWNPPPNNKTLWLLSHDVCMSILPPSSFSFPPTTSVLSYCTHQPWRNWATPTSRRPLSHLSQHLPDLS